MHGSPDICICGDFNARTSTAQDFVDIDPSVVEHTGLASDMTDDMIMSDSINVLNIQKVRVNQDKSVPNASGKSLINMCKNHNLLIANGRAGFDGVVGNFTSRERTTIDYVLMTPGLLARTLYFETRLFDPLYSDKHRPIDFTLKYALYDKDANKQPTKKTKQKRTIVKIKWNDECGDQFASSCQENNLNELNGLCEALETSDLIGVYLEKMKTIYKDCKIAKTVEYIEKDTIPKKKQPFYDDNCHNAKRKYTKSKRKHQKARNEDNYQSMIKASYEYKKILRKARYAHLRRKRKELRAAYNNPKEYWKLLDTKPKSKPVKATLESLTAHYKELNKKEQTEAGNLPAQTEPSPPRMNVDILDRPITEKEITLALRGLKNNKAPGEDKVLNEFLKHTFPIISKFYTHVFNEVLSSGEFPESWGVGTIIPIYKNKGSPEDAKNYRGITLVSSLGKLFTKVINDRLNRFSGLNDIINETQAGFRKNHSTVDQVFVLQTLIELALTEKRKLYVAFVDYKQAFDRVWREGLWFKLVQEEISRKMVKLIRNMYSKIKSTVFLNGTHSPPFASHAGVRQGENLSPFLFALYINDLETFMRSQGTPNITVTKHTGVASMIQLFLVLYADDTAILADSPEGLQKSLDLLDNYCEKWKLTVNAEKTKIVVFESQNTHETDRYEFMYKGQKLDIVLHFKYLGITLSKNGSLSPAVEDLCEQARKATYTILKKARTLDLPIDLQIDLFHKLVYPILSYGCEMWGYEKLDKLDEVHLNFLRHVLRLNKGTPIAMIYGETGEVPISLLVKVRVFKFYCKMTDSLHVTLSRKICNMLHTLYSRAKYTSKWLRFVKNLFAEYGKLNLFDTRMSLPVNSVSNAYKHWLVAQYADSWSEKLSSLSKCNSYSLYKTSFVREKYLSALPPALAVILCRFRTSNHKLEIEKLRYVRPIIPRANRYCTLCMPRQCLGNETHFLLFCSEHEALRVALIPSKYHIQPSYTKYLNLMSNKNLNVMFRLSLYIQKGLKLHK